MLAGSSIGQLSTISSPLCYLLLVVAAVGLCICLFKIALALVFRSVGREFGLAVGSGGAQAAPLLAALGRSRLSSMGGRRFTKIKIGLILSGRKKHGSLSIFSFRASYLTGQTVDKETVIEHRLAALYQRETGSLPPFKLAPQPRWSPFKVSEAQLIPSLPNYFCHSADEVAAFSEISSTAILNLLRTEALSIEGQGNELLIFPAAVGLFTLFSARRFWQGCSLIADEVDQKNLLPSW